MADALDPIYLIAGTDRAKVLRAVRRLRTRVAAEGGSEDLFEAATAAVDDVAGACLALGLFAGPRLVLVDGVEDWAAKDLGPIEAYAKDPTPSTTLPLVAGPKLRADHRVRKLAATPLLFDVPSGKALAGYLRKEAERIGARLEPDALRRLLDVVGENVVALESELDKLATYARGEPIDAALVDELAFPAATTAPWALTDAISARDRGRVFGEVGRLFDRDEKPHALLPQVARHVDRLRRARRAEAAGTDVRAFAKETGMHEFPARKLYEAAARYSDRECATALARLAAADHDMKGASRLEPEFVLERALRTIA